MSRALVGWATLAALAGAPGLAHAQGETIGEIRVHGNHATPDADVIALSGLKTGETASDERLRAAEQALRGSDRFDGVEVRKRFRAIDDPADILVMIVVDERLAVTPDDLLPGPWKRLRAMQQWFPILTYEDGYGLTYGARTSVSGAVGARSRISVPLSWGGERRAAVEVERAFDSGPLSLVRGTVQISRRVNPFYDASDVREGVRVDADRQLWWWLRAGANARAERVEFGGGDGVTHSAGGAGLTLDTRIDPSFPRNAVFARVGWERVAFGSGSANRVLGDARGFVGVGGSMVVALRGQMTRAGAPLPPAEQALLGGGNTLRGYPAGHRAGDSLAALSAELRVPLTSPLSVGRFGVKGFVDSGTVWSAGERLGSQPWERGIGGGVYFGAAVFMVDVDVAWPRQGNPRASASLGVTF